MSAIQTPRVSKLLWVLLVAAGCGIVSEEPGAAGAGPAQAAEKEAPEPTLYGRWTITAINGSAPLRFPTAEAAQPSLVFSPTRYGGSSGCNSFGGTGLMVENRWFGEPPMATQQGCADLEGQEETIFAIAASGPSIRFLGASEAVLTSRAGSLRLRREGDGPAVPEPRPMLLAGTRWQVGTIDGNPLPAPGGRHTRLLSFEADRWTLTGWCAPLAGSWRQAGEVVTMEMTPQPPRTCGPAQAAADEALRAMFAAGSRYVVGPNRELVMASGEHWLTGEFDRGFVGGGGIDLRGEWRIDTIDGAAPAARERPASLAFGRAGYAIWNGCNHSEGILLIHARQLFTLGSGVSTLALCPPDPLAARIGRIVGGNPRIARTAEGGLALVSPSGTLRLTRISSRAFGTGEQLGLRAPATIRLRDPQARLELLAGGRFAVVLDCGRIEGEWRGGQPARFSPGPLERTAPSCSHDPGSSAFRLSQFFTGDVLAVTGPNRDIVLLVNEDQGIGGRIER